MAQLLVRNLEPELVEALKRRAVGNGRSAEEEHREILRAALGRGSFKSALLAMPDVGEDEDFELPREHGRVETV